MDQQQPVETTDDATGTTATRSSSMLDRLWKSHPWKSDIADNPNSKRRSLGPAPSVSKVVSWSEKPEVVQVESDEVSLGEEAELQQKQDNDGVVTTPAPAISTPAVVAAVAAVVEESNKTNPSVKEENNNNHDTNNSDEMNLLDFDLDDPEIAQDMREAIGEEVLAMWDAQGLYEGMPELRNEILKGVVENKFVALQKEQKEQRAAMPFLNSSLAMCNIHIIEEDSEEESSSSDDVVEQKEEDTTDNKMQAKEEQVKSQPKVQKEEDLPTNTTTDNVLDEEYAMRSFLVLEELEQLLPHAVDTTDHECVEAEGRLGKLPPKEVPIKDVHAFNKYKLHDALEKRFSQIFTGNHQVVEGALDNDDESDTSSKRAARRSSLPNLPSQKQEPQGIAASMKEVLSMSFSVFDAFVQSKQQNEQALVQVEDDEWTEYTESLGEEASKGDLKKVAADMDDTLKHFNSSRGSDDGSFAEMTVEKTVVSGVVDVDDVSEQRSEQRERDQKSQQRKAIGKEKTQADTKPIPTKKSPMRTVSNDVSYMEFTVYDDVPEMPVRLNNHATPRESMITKSGDPFAINNNRPPNRQLGAAMASNFPTITTTQLDDDDMTQITFDHSMDGGASTTQDHVLASAYLNKEKDRPWRKDRSTAASGNNSPNSKSRSNRISLSPRKNHSSFDSQQTDPTLMEESSMSQQQQQQRQGESSVSSSRTDSAAGLKKSVAKILRVDIWSPKATVVQSALERLGQAAQHGSAQRTNIARLGGVMAIVRAMQMHSHNVTIQVKACQALEYLSVDAGTQAAVTEVGGMAAVVQAMRCHSKEQDVQAAACNVLAAITCPHSADCDGPSESDDDEENPLDGVVTTLVTAMNQHPKNTEIQAKAFGALANLCLDDQKRLRELSESGGLTAMTMALQRPWKNRTDQHESISTLSILLRSLAELDSSQHLELDKPQEQENSC